MARVMFKRIENSSDINDIPVLDGQLIYTKDGNQFMDYEGQRIMFGAGGTVLVDASPIGIIYPFAGSTIPDNYLLADGSAVSRTTYSDLFAIIGTTYGAGDGSNTFNLPNLKGRIPVGIDANDTAFDTLGETGGEKTHTLTIDEMPAHKHSLNFYNTGSGGNAKGVPYNAISNTLVGGDNAGCNNSGGGQAHNNLQPYITLNYIIKAKNSIIIE